MSSSPTPRDEEERLVALRKLNILDSPVEDRYDRITRLACRVLDVPIAAISFVDQERIWVKASCGLKLREHPRENSLCDHALENLGLTEIADASSDHRFARNAMVAGASAVRFYASYPITTPDGRQVGGMCLIDHQPRELSGDDREVLRDFAHLVEDEIRMDVLSATQSELMNDLDSFRRKVFVDSLTQVWNRPGILEILSREHERAKRDGSNIGVALVDLDNFKRVNDAHGHLAGDTVLRVAAERMNEAVRPYDAVGRYGGEEFLVVIVENDANEIAMIAERIREHISYRPISANRNAIRVSASVGVVCGRSDMIADTISLIKAADDALYRAKRAGRNRVEIVRFGPATSTAPERRPH